jgi:hypothetical protein
MRAKNAQTDEARRRIDAGEIFPIHEVYVSTNTLRKITQRQTQKYSGRVLTPKLLGGEHVLLTEFTDPREPLMQWLRSRENPFFARAFVNRVWAGYFHRGLIDPADDLNLANPPVNAAVLDYLAAGFIAHGYDMKWLHREIVSSDAYQRSWRPNATNRLDDRNFSRFVPRRLPAEVLLDALTLATAAGERQRTFAADVANRKIGPDVTAFGLLSYGTDADYALTAFGKPSREMNCDCERSTVPTLLQTLYVRNDPDLLARIDGQRDAMPAWITELRDAPRSRDAAQLATEVFLRTVSRPPTAEELQQARADIAAAKDPISGVRDLLWAMLNTREFLVNH